MPNIKDALGFTDGMITVILGDTQHLTEPLKDAGARYHRLFGWYFPGDVRLTYTPPVGTYMDIIYWNYISTDDVLNSETSIKKFMRSLEAEPSASEHLGEIGDVYEGVVTCTGVSPFLTKFGMVHYYKFVDNCSNVLLWKTSSTSRLLPNKKYRLRGRIKDHTTYMNEDQTVLSYCRYIEVDDEQCDSQF